MRGVAMLVLAGGLMLGGCVDGAYGPDGGFGGPVYAPGGPLVGYQPEYAPPPAYGRPDWERRRYQEARRDDYARREAYERDRRRDDDRRRAYERDRRREDDRRQSYERDRRRDDDRRQAYERDRGRDEAARQRPSGPPPGRSREQSEQARREQAVRSVLTQ
ncbi:hypothetical protein [Roseomonas sp. BN140053]|uniref:hypothetical protein n=1 Tax=Roseomonas sp. BN140053 TaxID=3391898 RepID=UPI0039EA49C9